MESTLNENGQNIAIGKPTNGNEKIVYESARRFVVNGDESGLVLDSKCDLYCRLVDREGYNRTDVVISPGHAESATWSPLAELKDRIDCDRIAYCLLGDNASDVQKLYVSTCLEVCYELQNMGYEPTTRMLINYLSEADREHIAKILGDEHTSMGIFDHDMNVESGRYAGRAIAGALDLLPHDAGFNGFSIRDYVANDRHNSFLFALANERDGERGAMLATMVAGVYFDALNLTASIEKEPNRSWFFADEIGQYPLIPNLAKALALCSKNGLRSVVTLQSINSLSQIYGEAQSEALLSSFDQRIMQQPPDIDTARWQRRQELI